MSPLNYLLLGAISMGFLTAGLFFLRFYRDTKDRLFLWFSLSFVVMALNCMFQSSLSNPAEGVPGLYVIRALAYCLIVAGIIQKNMVRDGDRDGDRKK